MSSIVAKDGVPPPSVLLIDVMDTLVHEPFHQEMPAFFGLTLVELMAVKHPTAWIEFELGQMSEEEFLMRFFRDGRSFDRLAFLGMVEASYRWLPGMERMLARLARTDLRIHALSNYPNWYLRIEERLRLSRYLEWSFVSCRTGVRKPEPRAFTEAARSLGVPPGDCLLVDDRDTNCRAARALGMRAVRFIGAGDLWYELEQHGILLGEDDS